MEIYLGTDDREIIEETEEAAALARSLLERAQERAKGLSLGELVSVTLTRDHRNVHRLELMLALEIISPEYGFEIVIQHNNTHTFKRSDQPPPLYM